MQQQFGEGSGRRASGGPAGPVENRTSAGPDSSGDWIEALRHHATARGDEAAVSDGRETLSYRALHEASDRLAARLAAAGAGRGSAIAIVLERSFELVAALCAIHKIGAHYVPLDPHFPRERLLAMVGETGAVRIVVDRAHASTTISAINALATAGLPLLDLAVTDAQESSGAAPRVVGSRDDLACVLYTSGSTGVPKGVELTRGNVLNCLAWMQEQYALGSDDRVLHKTPYTFDVSMYELFWPLMAGSCIVLARPEGHRDPGYLAELIAAERITAAHFVPSMLTAFVEEPAAAGCSSLRHVFAAGEALPYALTQRFFERLPQCALHNLYGPTEAGVVSHWTCPRSDPRQIVPIGWPVANTALHLLDDRRDAVADGDEGELWIGGAQVARGYVGQPDLTAERFIEIGSLGRLYKTGDRARRLAGGELEYLGRQDHQVKIRGIRVELGEIESQLNLHPAIVEAVAAVRESAAGDQRLIAWFQPRGTAPDAAELRAHLAARLPEHMLPQAFVAIDALPHLPNGKIDRKALPEPKAERPALATSYRAPRNELERAIAGIWESVLGFTGIGVDDRFFEAGGTSLLALQVVARVRQLLGRRVPLTTFFAAPTVAAFAAALQGEHSDAVGSWLAGARPIGAAAQASQAASEPRPGAGASEPIAIVGMACRTPGADDLEAFWDLVAAAREGIRDLDDSDLAAAGVPVDALDASYVRRAGTVRDAYCFDADFFGLTPAEAELTDPQHRVLLECTWHALEHAGIAGGGQRIGVYAGLAHNHYFDHSVATHDDLRSGERGFQTVIGADKDYAATRIAFKLDLRGPALTLQTACSSSGVALHLAVQGIRNGDCEAAVVAGVRINVPDTAGYRYVDGAPLAPDGKVRPFDARATGMVLTSGVACLVVKPLSRALADGDRVYALVRGTAVNNDGAGKAGYTAPSQAGQADVIRAALAAAGVTPDTVGLVEAHGTGTFLGDPIEVAALTEAYGQADRIALGSVKGNVGHMDAGAGAISLIKTALALHRRQLPPSIHYTAPNPECAFEHTPFFVNTALADWPSTGPRRAGVSSFGFGGTNFHAVLEEPPAQQSRPSARPFQLLKLSARNDEALRRQTTALAQRLEADAALNLADVAYTLDVGRARLPRRGFVVASDAHDAVAKLCSGALRADSPSDAQASIVFMFPGQGAQHVDMGKALYEHEPVFRDAVDLCAGLVQTVLGEDLRSVMYPRPEHADHAAEQLRATQLAQLAIFAVSYATARLWQSWGLRADTMVGHSLGEFVAATLAGVFELEHAVRIIAERARLMQSMTPGGMLAVRLAEDAVRPYLSGDVELAGVNSPSLLVLSGPHDALSAVQARLQADGVATSPLHTSHAFHSSMMEPMVEPFAKIVAQYPLKAPQTRFVSTLTGDWVSAEEMQKPLYWARQLREAVRFGPAVQKLLETRGRIFLEVGPGQALTTSVRQALKPEHRAVVVASMPHAANESADALEHLLGAAGRLYASGIEFESARFWAGEQRLKVGLPGYPFARSRFFLEPQKVLHGATAIPQSSTVADLSRPAASPDEPAVRAPLLKLLAKMTGIDFQPEQFGKSFLELGLDSLMLTQIAGKLKNEFKIELRFRQLMEEFTCIEELERHLGEHGTVPGAPALPKAASTTSPETPAAQEAPPRTFGAGARISKAHGDGLDERQQKTLQALSQRYLAKTGKSREFAQKHRQQLADPRTVSGFRPLIKELVYPIVVDRSDGAYLWDLDGNRYIDTTCGFGSVFFGHKPRFVAEAIAEQLQRGWEIGPQTPLAGECAELFTRATGLDRVAFCNTGSEAVLAAVRLARTVTGRNVVVSFAGDYHGIQDEVIVRAGANLRSIPAAPGIPPESVANTLILDYGAPESLKIIRERADDIAACLIEPVQSRRCDFYPRAFLRELRQITEQAGIAFIMDEVITGFRSGLRGAQEFYGVRADIGTYGKVFGGGVPIGAIAGIPRFMDALDGGQWQYGDDSVPEAGVTYFAGTFVRHPLTLAAVRACLQQLLDHPEWPNQVAEKTRQMVDAINADFHRAGAPMHLARYSSLWKPAYDVEQTHGDLLFFLLRERGIHIWEGRPCFLTTAHSDADCEAIIEAFRGAVAEMQAGGFLQDDYEKPVTSASELLRASSGWRNPYAPPAPGARIGRDRLGNPAWFVPDPQRPGRYLQLERLQ